MYNTRGVDLEGALRQFELTETNLVRLEEVWAEMRGLIPDGIVFLAGSPEAASYASLARDLRELVGSLPAIDGWSFEIDVPDPDDVAQARLDAAEISEPAIYVEVERSLAEPADVIAEYRHRLDRARRKLVRKRALELLTEVDLSLEELAARVERDGQSLSDDDSWRRLLDLIAEAERLIGNSVERRGRWSDLRRHLSFAQGVDLHDIADHDWPSVRNDLEAALYAEREPLPVEVDDLGALAEAQPAGGVSAALAWAALDAEAFERLVFALIAATSGYENVQWLMHTNAPDRSRDLSADRVVTDPLSGTVRQRVIVQCKNWTTKSVAVGDVNDTVAAMTLWEPPPVDVLVVATTGRFTADAVAWIERHNHERKRPRIEPWPDSHLELLLAQRADLVTGFGLRPR